MVEKRTIGRNYLRYAGSFKITGMRYYLDTNILIFVLFGEHDSIHRDVKEILEDYANSLLVSSVAVQEMILLYRIGKLNSKPLYRNEKDLIQKIEELNIQTVFFSKENNSAYCDLQIADNHKDMNDYLMGTSKNPKIKACD